jgi:mRNA interferase MazF
MLVVPFTPYEALAHWSFAERIEPAADKGSETTCWALARHVTSVSLRRVSPTTSRIAVEQLSSIRKRIMVAVAAA